MAKNIFVGVNSVAKKPKNIYVGVNNVARKVIAAYVGVNGVARKVWPNSRIPDTSYQEIEWVLGNIINTGVDPSSFPRIVIDFMPTKNDRSGIQKVIDGEFYASGRDNPYGLAVYYDESSNYFSFSFDYGDVAGFRTNDSEGILVNKRYIFDINNSNKYYVYCESGYYSISSHNYLGQASSSYTGSQTGSSEIRILGYSDYENKFRIYNVKMYNKNGTLIRDFVPCYRISDNQCGYYDVVNRIFYTYYNHPYDPEKDGPIV